MKKKWILGIAMGTLLALSITQVALAQGETPGAPGGSKNCIGYCESRGYLPIGVKDDFARDHNPSGTAILCPMIGPTDIIPDLLPPQP